MALTARFDCGSTKPGTRSFHLFVPQGKGVVSYKRCADDDEFAGTHDFFKNISETIVDVHVNDYCAAWCDKRWWVGVVSQMDTETADVLVKFMHPPGPRPSFYWPEREDVCWVPQCDIIRVLETPTTSSSGRSYKLSSVDIDFLKGV